MLCEELAGAVARLRDPLAKGWAEHPKFGRVGILEDLGGVERKLRFKLADGSEKVLLARFLEKTS